MKLPVSTATGWVLIAALAALTAYMTLTLVNRPVVLDSNDAVDELRQLPDMRIDINTASAAEMSVLPGLGPLLAERFVDNRATQGPIASIDDLDRVNGFGPAIIERIRPYAVVGDSKK
jgi:competence ComEA-like helix-hairpin-helix protein